VKQAYFQATEEQIEVNNISPTGYPMRMIRNCPALGSGVRPNCEAFGYLLDGSGHCQYAEAWVREQANLPEGQKVKVRDKTCLCTHMRNFDCWTCGHYTWRLKETSLQNPDGSYRLLSAEHVFRDYRYSTGDKIDLPVSD
jgi:nitronate monooxygenase